MPVYAGPAGPFIGYLAGGAALDPGNGGTPIPALNISVIVNGETRSVWRREIDAQKWYVPMGRISAQDCRWTPPDLLDRPWKPAPLEYGLDVPLWHHLLSSGWSTHHGLFPADSI